MSGDKRYYVYMMASRSLTLYTGMTGDLCRRALQHKSGEIEGFTKRYHINRLVYYEAFKYVSHAIAREKQIKALDTCQTFSPDQVRKPRLARLGRRLG